VGGRELTRKPRGEHGENFQEGGGTEKGGKKVKIKAEGAWSKRDLHWNSNRGAMAGRTGIWDP